ncbi:BREX-1 system adenine-specific DNA-methyltransferase PglX [Rhizobium ruizarguesonis]|uniref:BREX-1 system adenine-specific DNA-methyltransferase PglX n=1 Tax=Rhizobium ruizarguesonis TaxID=2081791 RepID=UPI00103E287B|nr:BREX-1 system adenine-specific DNA-methyltransferase PglX [Rhizobium ruizarguesonis]MBY5806100.1 BREX-1 system adenine-specific DNA-methyltransferase PglX [Rhizobium leguminosarum]TCB12109.1 BREX-1 system adenine-specific DNA-methyltransferase PglX [Rhizobium leguminosarum bv. viciae]MBY5846862.1 BREX-1 system adenine-specific DNA-methyltransferase PglX [Rhizobium leguminosarum]NEH87935.1 BREX-1 system adenine-specific DNA-methyltransferase PglX [Rhizobium ruizarguesonis]NEJ58074.1 BREX-1 s
MDTSKLKKFAQFARRTLIEQVSAKLDAVRSDGAAAQREHPKAFKKLQQAIVQDGENEVIERVAYTWFNRFTALRFLDVHELNPVLVVSAVPGQFQPEILADAKAGNINEQLVPEKIRTKVQNLLGGITPSPDSQAEAYRLLLVAACNYWQHVMPFLFERIDDFTELLLPADLQSNSSILAYLREAMTPEVGQDVEVIGWLYQFYISEKKDQVFAGLKKNIKIAAENIPAATQLFTPHWIVRYLVENSLGRLWLLNRPGSKLAAQMDYYIAPAESEMAFLKIGKPEEIKICDPACGSGHMLTYAFDLLHAIYEEEGYDPAEIPGLILKHNLIGIEIDDRAGALAAFALAMKAAAKLGRRRFIRMEVKPEIVVLQNVTFTSAELTDVAAVVGKDLYTNELRDTLTQFEQAKNFGSLILPKLRDPAETLRVVEARDFSSDLLLKEVQARVVAVLRMAEALSPKYHVVVANPPYMSSGNANTRLNGWLKSNYEISKSDLMTAFMERGLMLVRKGGALSMINLPSWMFLSSFSDLRKWLLEETSITSLLHLGRGIFGSDFGTTAFVLFQIKPSAGHTPVFRKLFDKHVDVRSSEKIRENFLKAGLGEFKTPQENLLKIPGAPFAYWVNEAVSHAFRSELVDNVGKTRRGLQTGDKDRFIRCWHETSSAKTDFRSQGRGDKFDSSKTWYRFNNGGPFRKWYGNLDLVVDWQSNGRDIKDTGRAIIPSEQLYFEAAVCWGRLTSGPESYRVHPAGVLPGDLSPCFYSESNDTFIAYFNTVVSRYFKSIINPTLTNTVGDLAKIPAGRVEDHKSVNARTDVLIGVHQYDWNAYETSWDFTTLPLLSPDHRDETLEDSYARLRAHWQGMTDAARGLEHENNRIFIDAYGLQDELTPEVPLEEITLTCNPAYRYGVKGTTEEREARLNADTMAEFLSYSVGCMFGRYSLDAPGLILANQGETLADYLANLQAKGVAEPSFLPDADNVIPVLDGDWFPDDIVDRFRKFLRVTFGEERFRENLAFIEAQIGDIRKYFTRTFYDDHLKRYKKRPIYWMFSSPKSTFQALIYMHRYRPETISLLLNDYLREFIRKLEAERARLDKLSDDPSAAQNVRTRALKDVGTVAKQIAELEEWERDVIFPLAQKKIEIDLDEGVKRNYSLFGAALKPIKGLEAADE